MGVFQSYLKLETRHRGLSQANIIYRIESYDTELSNNANTHTHTHTHTHTWICASSECSTFENSHLEDLSSDSYNDSIHPKPYLDFCFQNFHEKIKTLVVKTSPLMVNFIYVALSDFWKWPNRNSEHALGRGGNQAGNSWCSSEIMKPGFLVWVRK